MLGKISKKYVLLLIGIAAIGIAVGIALFTRYDQPALHPQIASTNIETDTPKTPNESVELYKGEVVTIADTFSVKVPNGWRASISTTPSFLGVMFARPNQLESLTYNTELTPAIDYGGIPTWSGLTEHFFIIAPTTARSFKVSDHLEASSAPFIFNDSTVGTKFSVIKYAAEAKNWGGLQKDTEWQGRTYIYEKDGKKIEAHVALYPSSTISLDFYEKVIRTLHF